MERNQPRTVPRTIPWVFILWVGGTSWNCVPSDTELPCVTDNDCDSNEICLQSQCQGINVCDCDLDHAVADCTETGACAVKACEAGWKNADGAGANGCELCVDSTVCGEDETALPEGEVDGSVDADGEAQDEAPPETEGCVGVELCDGLDNDCNGLTDDGLVAQVASLAVGVCAGAVKVCAGATGWVDPNFNSIIGYEPAETLCDGLDNDCDGETDDGLVVAFYPDADNDGYGELGAVAVMYCAANDVSGMVQGDSSDCDDNSPGVNPGALDLGGSGFDEDCDGLEYCFVDEDGDGFAGNAAAVVTADVLCAGPGMALATEVDCQDGSNGIPSFRSHLFHPEAEELCGNHLDEDCSGVPDDGCECEVEGELKDCGVAVGVCAGGKGMSTCKNGAWGVCDGQILPDPEICDDLDNDCDGETDEGGVTADCTDFYVDEDGDSFGAGDGICLCTLVPGYSADKYDCNDADGAVHPTAPEICNLHDDDCDLAIDEDIDLVQYADVDGDQYGDPGVSISGECPAEGYVAAAGDCNDSTAGIHPTADEQCNGTDEDCDGTSDALDPQADLPCTTGYSDCYDREGCDADGDGPTCGFSLKPATCTPEELALVCEVGTQKMLYCNRNESASRVACCPTNVLESSCTTDADCCNGLLYCVLVPGTSDRVCSRHSIGTLDDSEPPLGAAAQCANENLEIGIEVGIGFGMGF